MSNFVLGRRIYYKTRKKKLCSTSITNLNFLILPHFNLDSKILPHSQSLLKNKSTLRTMGSTTRKSKNKEKSNNNTSNCFEMKIGMHVLWYNPNIRKDSNKEEYWVAQIQDFNKELIDTNSNNNNNNNDNNNI